jgi:hypothetical protein
MPNGPLQPAASDEPGSQTQGPIEVAAERDGVCIATLRRAKFYIGVGSSKGGKSDAGGGLCPLRRISGQDAQILFEHLEHLEHLAQTNDLFGIVAKLHALGHRWGTHPGGRERRGTQSTERPSA